jgi:SAM-dependent methyltransferase
MTKKISELNYVEFISLISEVNRPPGGLGTVYTWIEKCFIEDSSKVLEIGSNTGFTSIEIARVKKSTITGIDVSIDAVNVAKEWVKSENLNNVSFQVGNAESINFPNGHFDVLVCGGATSFISNKKLAISEYSRVLKDFGKLGASQFYYRKTPPDALINKLNNVLGIKIEVWDRLYWEDLFESNGFEIYYKEEFEAPTVNIKRIEQYAEDVCKAKLSNLPKDQLDIAIDRTISIMSLFNDNHKYLGYSIMCMRKISRKSEYILFK